MLLRHAYEVADLQVKDGRTLILAVVPINTPAWVEDETGRYRERFAPGAFKHCDPTRVQLRYMHSTDMRDRMGAGVTMHEDGKYLIGTARVFPGDRGDHLLTLVNERELRGVSVGFYPGIDRPAHDQDGPLLERVRVKRMPEWSLVDEPAYRGSEVLAVREAQDSQLRREQALAWVRESRRILL